MISRRLNFYFRKIWLAALIALVVPGLFANAQAENIGVWDKDTQTFSRTFTNADSIDNGTSNAPSNTTNMVVDSQGRVYITFRQSDGSQQHLYLVRYDRTTVGIWDNGTSAFTTTFSNGDPIDKSGVSGIVGNSVAMGVDSQDRVYVAFIQNTGSRQALFLTRYDGTDVKIWDNDTSSFTDSFADADPIDRGSGNVSASSTENLDLEIDSQDRVNIAFIQYDGSLYRLYLTRFDGSDVKIWDNGASAFTDTFSDADPIDRASSSVTSVNAVVDNADRLYLPFTQGSPARLYLTRFDGTDAKIWDNGASTFTDTFSDGDPIDHGTGSVDDSFADPVADSQGRIYFAFQQGSPILTYLSRFDGTDVKIWDNDTSTFTDTFSNGDPITPDTSSYVQSRVTNLIVDQNDRVYIPIPDATTSDVLLYLARYDGSDVAIWDKDSLSFTDTFSNADPINTSNGSVSWVVSAALGADNSVLFVYPQSFSSNNRMFISRHTGSAAQVWDNGTDSFTSTLANGDPVDDGASTTIGNAGQPTDAVISPTTGELFYAFEKGSELYFGRLGGLPSEQEINITGNSNSIADGDSSPSTTDHTDFGSAEVSVTTVDRTFTVQNTGNVTLTLGGSPRVVIGGTNAADFSVTHQPAASVGDSSSSTFTVRFSPSALGTRSATISIQSNDRNEGVYNFSIQGSGVDPTDTDNDGSFDAIDSDDDNDGVSDSQESTDGTNPLDSGSHMERLTATFCSEWNSFLGMQNINEYVNSSSTSKTITATLYDRLADPKSSSELTVAAHTQRDLLVHDLSGFAPNSYGKLCSEVQPSGGVDGRMVYYKPNDHGFDFAFALPFTSGQSGPQFTPFNTFQPSLKQADSADLVVNWIQVTNLELSTQTGTLYYYADDGSTLGTEAVSLAAESRTDFPAHKFGPSRVGIVEWRPTSQTAKFLMRNNRYYYADAEPADSFDSAMQIEGVKGSGDLMGVPLDTRNKTAVLELGNTTNNSITVTALFYQGDGTLAATRVVNLGAHASFHVIADEILTNTLGSATIQSNSIGSAFAVGMHYGRNSSRGIDYIYGIIANSAKGQALTNSYNTFLGQSCEMLLVNPSSSSVVATVTARRLDGTIIVNAEQVTTPARGITSYDLCAKDAANNYGTVKIHTGADSLLSTVIRIGANNDYRFPTPARSVLDSDICSAGEGANGC